MFALIVKIKDCEPGRNPAGLAGGSHGVEPAAAYFRSSFY